MTGIAARSTGSGGGGGGDAAAASVAPVAARAGDGPMVACAGDPSPETSPLWIVAEERVASPAMIVPGAGAPPVPRVDESGAAGAGARAAPCCVVVRAAIESRSDPIRSTPA
jgi:hypothetical protein